MLTEPQMQFILKHNKDIQGIFILLRVHIFIGFRFKQVCNSSYKYTKKNFHSLLALNINDHLRWSVFLLLQVTFYPH